MKTLKTILLVITLAFSTVVVSQIRFGYTPEEIEKDFPGGEIGVGSTEDGQKFMSIVYEGDLAIYLFDKNGYCIGNSIVPGSKESLEKLLEVFDEDYIKVSDSIWVFRYGSGVVKIEMVLDEGEVFFVLTIED